MGVDEPNELGRDRHLVTIEGKLVLRVFRLVVVIGGSRRGWIEGGTHVRIDTTVYLIWAAAPRGGVGPETTQGFRPRSTAVTSHRSGSSVFFRLRGFPGNGIGSQQGIGPHLNLSSVCTYLPCVYSVHSALF